MKRKWVQIIFRILSIVVVGVTALTPLSAMAQETGLISDEKVPGPDNTGILPGSELEDIHGDLNITKPGVYENLDVHGFVNVRAANVEIRNCRIRGGQANNWHGLIHATNKAVSNLLIENVELVPEHPSYWLTGVLGHDYTARYVNVYQTVDGFGVYNTHNKGGPTNVTIEYCYCHHLAYYSPDPTHGDNRSHNDCIQIQGGSGTIVRFNTLHAYNSSKVGTLNYDHPQALSGIMLNDNVGKTTDIVIEDNLIRGGEIGINGGGLNYSSSDFLGTIHRNQFNHGQYHSGHAIGLNRSVNADTGDITDNQNLFIDGDPVIVRYY